MAANHSTTPIEREAHLKEVWALYKLGTAITEIAKQLSYSRQAIHYDIRQLHKRWWKENLDSMDEHKARELAKVDQLEAAAWDAWIASGGTHIVSTSKKGTNTDGEDYQESKDVQEELVGDPRFLERISWCIDKRCKILGLETSKIDLSILPQQIQQMTNEQLRQFTQGLLSGTGVSVSSDRAGAQAETGEVL